MPTFPQTTTNDARVRGVIERGTEVISLTVLDDLNPPLSTGLPLHEKTWFNNVDAHPKKYHFLILRGTSAATLLELRIFLGTFIRHAGRGIRSGVRAVVGMLREPRSSGVGGTE